MTTSQMKTIILRIKRNCESLILQSENESPHIVQAIIDEMHKDIALLKSESMGANPQSVLPRREPIQDPIFLMISALMNIVKKLIREPKESAKALSSFAKRYARPLIVVGVLGAGLLMGRSMYYQNRGLTGEYYIGTNFENMFAIRKDPKIDFYWGWIGPFLDIGKENFSVRWKGKIEISKEGTYTFFTKSDDGVRVYINGQRIINDWNVHEPTLNSGATFLKKGTQSLVVEYFQGGGPGSITLYWMRPGDTKKRVLSSRYLRPYKK